MISVSMPLVVQLYTTRGLSVCRKSRIQNGTSSAEMLGDDPPEA